MVAPLLGLVARELRGISENTWMFYEPFIVEWTRARERYGLEATPVEQAIASIVAWFISGGRVIAGTR